MTAIERLQELQLENYQLNMNIIASLARMNLLPQEKIKESVQRAKKIFNLRKGGNHEIEERN